jgi:AraC-like DNA-binding protein
MPAWRTYRRKLLYLDKWIVRHLEFDLRPTALAGRLGISERTLVRYFCIIWGETPSRRIRRLRLEAAYRDIVNMDEPLKVIVNKYGFRTETQLRRSFLKHYGITPAEARRQSALAEMEDFWKEAVNG